MRSDPFIMALLFVFLTSSLWHVEGFSTRSIPRPAGVSTSRQYLKPQQGSELVEASEHVYRHYEKDEDERTDYEGHQEKLIKVSLSSHHHPTVEKHRSFVRRAFSLPSYLWHPHAKVEGVRMYEEDNGTPQDGKQDVVYFPIVGFRYVNDAPGHSRPLPQLTSPSCRLHNEHEVYYGRFHPRNKVQDPDQQHPIGTESTKHCP